MKCVILKDKQTKEVHIHIFTSQIDFEEFLNRNFIFWEVDKAFDNVKAITTYDSKQQQN